MKFQQITSILLFIVLNTREAYQKMLLISHSGVDFSDCGTYLQPCGTILYTVSKRTRNNDVIKLDNHASQIMGSYTIEAPLPLFENITLMGINGRPTIRGENSSFLGHLFKDKVKGSFIRTKLARIQIVNIYLKGIGIVRVKEPSAVLVVQVINCTISELMGSNNSSIIDSSATKSTIAIKNSLLYSFSKGICLNSHHVEFKIETSKIMYDDDKYSGQQCPQFIDTDQLVSLTAHFVSSTFKRVILIDTNFDKQGKSNISIRNCSFDDEKINSTNHECSSGIRLRNSTVFVANTKFSNMDSGDGLIYVSSTFVVFKECAFMNIKSKSSLIALNSNSNACFHNCHVQNNEIFARSGVTYLNGSRGWFENCTFENNTANGPDGHGGAVSAVSNSVLNIQKCVFKWNKARTSGGAIYTSHPFSVNISQCLFKENHATFDGGAIKHFGRRHSVMNIFWCYFKRNKSVRGGGAIAIHKGNLLVKNTKFVNNNVVGIHSNNGGAIYISSDLYSNVYLFWCYFNNNKAKFFGGAISHWGNALFIINTTFKDNAAISSGVGTVDDPGEGGALYSSQQSSVILSWCFFMGNTAERHGGAISHWGIKLSLTNVVFEYNIAPGLKFAASGGAVFAENSQLIADLSWCYFEGNMATSYGGAMMYFGKRLSVQNTTFKQNTVVSKSAQGGALYAISRTRIEVGDSSFEGNVARWAGGAISHLGTGNLLVKGSLFQTSSHSHSKNYFGGEILHSSGKLVLHDVFVQDRDKYNALNSLLIHTGKFQYIKISGIHVMCSRGKKILATLPEKLAALPKNNYIGKIGDSFLTITISCSSCPPKFYSISKGMLGPTIINRTYIHCHSCPFGGNCTNGQIRAANNFWGYSTEKHRNQIHFSSCPFGYCCFGSQCRHYNSCAVGREGILCGQCQKGLTESIVTPHCLVSKYCRHPWFLAVLFIGGIAYVLLFMYLKETAKFFSTLLIPWDIKIFITSENTFCSVRDICKNLLNRNSHMQLLTDDICCEDSTEYENVHLELLDTTELPKLEDVNKSDAGVFSGLFKIILFFYQTSVLFNVYSTGTSDRFIHFVQEVTVALFNLRIDGLFFQNFTWCPFDALRPVPKLLIKTSFVLYLFLIILTIFLIFKISSLFVKDNNHKLQKFSSRLYCCVLRILLISYATITVTCFTLISCVNLGSIGRVLHIDGSIKCYNWWQFVVIAIVCLWIASYPIAIYAASWLLHRNKLSSGRFLLALLLPFPVVIYWVYTRTSCHKDRAAKVNLIMDNVLTESNLSKGIVDVLEGPFRGYNGTHINNNYRIPWESVLIGRRFILIFIKTFVIDVLVRLYLMLFFTILFLIHHIYVRPFSSKFLNSTETVSLSMLIIIGALNILPAYVYINPIAISSRMQGYMNAFRHIETILMLVFPLLIGSCVIILGIVRTSQGIFCIIRNFVDLIHFVSKRRKP